MGETPQGIKELLTQKGVQMGDVDAFSKGGYLLHERSHLVHVEEVLVVEGDLLGAARFGVRGAHLVAMWGG